MSVLKGFSFQPRRWRRGGGGLGVCVAAHRVDTAVAAVLELALAVCAGLCRDGTDEEDEAEADDGDHVGC